MKLLDHGYATLVESWGSDQSIIEAARMSTDKGFLGWGPRLGCAHCELNADPAHRRLITPNCPGANVHTFKEIPGDEGLLAYLWKNKHVTPFEMAGLTIEVQTPIFVLRQWHRHRTQGYNEMSAMDYIPTLARLMGQSGITVVKNKQAGTVKDAETLIESCAEQFRNDLAEYQALGQGHYEKALADGIPKELARLFVTVGRYSRMRATANLRNWLGFLTLRMDPHAQYEIRVYAEAIGTMIAEKFPHTWELFAEGLK